MHVQNKWLKEVHEIYGVNIGNMKLDDIPPEIDSVQSLFL